MPPNATHRLQWFGVAEADMDAVLPNRINFPDLFQQGQLFELTATGTDAQ
jgi:hypothetical protein